MMKFIEASVSQRIMGVARHARSAGGSPAG